MFRNTAVILIALLIALMLSAVSIQAQSIEVIVGEDTLEVECAVLTTNAKVNGREVAPLWMFLGSLLPREGDRMMTEVEANLFMAWETCREQPALIDDLTPKHDVWSDDDGEDILIEMVTSDDPNCYTYIEWARSDSFMSRTDQLFWRATFIRNCID